MHEPKPGSIVMLSWWTISVVQSKPVFFFFLNNYYTIIEIKYITFQVK